MQTVKSRQSGRTPYDSPKRSVVRNRFLFSMFSRVSIIISGCLVNDFEILRRHTRTYRFVFVFMANDWKHLLWKCCVPQSPCKRAAFETNRYCSIPTRYFYIFQFTVGNYRRCSSRGQEIAGLPRFYCA